jgi:hypothetical protein
LRPLTTKYLAHAVGFGLFGYESGPITSLAIIQWGLGVAALPFDVKIAVSLVLDYFSLVLFAHQKMQRTVT